MSDYSTREVMNMSTREWEEKVCGIEFEDVLLVGGPLDGNTTEASVNANGPFRLDVAGKGVAQYQRVGRRSDGQARAEFIDYEDHVPPRLAPIA